MIDVLDVIASIEANKKSKNIVPSYALFSEITNEVTRQLKLELNQGVVDGKLSWNQTINSVGFSIKQ